MLPTALAAAWTLTLTLLAAPATTAPAAPTTPTAPAPAVPTAPPAAPTTAPASSPSPTTAPASSADLPADLAPEAAAWLDKIQAKASTIRTLEARLRYDRTQGLLKDTQTRFGSLVYQTAPTPRFAVHFDRLVVDERSERRSRWYIYDGVWLVEKLEDQKQFFKRQVVPPDAPAERRDPLALGEGPFAVPVTMNKERVLRRYRVELPAPDKADPANTVRLRLTPRDLDAASFQEIDIWYDRGSLLPIKVRSVNDSQTESVIQIREPQVNTPIEPSVFDTSPPKSEGWRVEVTPWEKAH